MSALTEFESFPKIPRWNREIIITEKIDGTNAQVVICEDGTVIAGSRNRFLTPTSDNYGFAAWVNEHLDELRTLGIGRHFGEWWGKGIQRNYGLDHRRFSLFNVSLWGDKSARPACCDVVPVLYRGPMSAEEIHVAQLTLIECGSIAAPKFNHPEGIVIYHTASGKAYKATFDGDGHKCTR